MAYKIITINREFESCGSEIAQAVAQRLNLTYVDKFLITEAAEHSGIDIAHIEETDEKLASRFAYSQAEAAHYYGGSETPHPTGEQVARAQFKIIMELAEQGPCLIVGRCANHLLREREDVLDVFIHAGRDYRVKRTMEKLGLPEKKAVKLLKATDKARKAYYKNYTGKDWNDPDGYHMILNADKMTFEQCVDLICKSYEA